MSELLDNSIDAHGGAKRWDAFLTVQATIGTGGALWGMKGLFQDPHPREMTVSLHEERASGMPFGAENQRTAFTPDRIAIETTNGRVVAKLANPRQSFEGHGMTTPWNPLHRAYFNGLRSGPISRHPFLKMPGVRIQELAPWTEGSEVWHRLRARFRAYLATHSEVQDFFFGPDLLVRRHDYEVEVAGRGVLRHNSWTTMRKCGTCTFRQGVGHTSGARTIGRSWIQFSSPSI